MSLWKAFPLLFFSLNVFATTYDPMEPKKEVWMGKKRALVILLEWDNRPHKISRDEIERVFFGMGDNDHSLRQYLLENSGGRFDLTGDVMEWRVTKHSWGRLWCMFQEKWTDMSDHMSGCSPKTVMKIAWNEVKDLINPMDYDSDGDGKIDFLYVVHSGRMWKERGTPDDVFYDNLPIAHEGAVFQSEGMGRTGKMIPIGFYLHESGHNNFLLGDYYGDGAGYEKGRYGIGMWGLMGLGAWGMSSKMPISELFRFPAPMEAASKVRSGWATAQVYTQSYRHVRLHPVETSADVAVVPLGEVQSDSFFLEYRSNRGHSRGHPGHGLLIWKGWELIQADGRDDLNHGHKLNRRPLPPNNENFGDSSDPFPGSLNVTSYKDPKSGLLIENIVQTDDYVEFDLAFPSAELERASYKAIRPSLRTLSPSFRPVSLNGRPFDFDLYPKKPGGPKLEEELFGAELAGACTI
jgi:M6 family metalloprotease-like protein